MRERSKSWTKRYSQHRLGGVRNLREHKYDDDDAPSWANQVGNRCVYAEELFVLGGMVYSILDDEENLYLENNRLSGYLWIWMDNVRKTFCVYVKV